MKNLVEMSDNQLIKMFQATEDREAQQEIFATMYYRYIDRIEAYAEHKAERHNLDFCDVISAYTETIWQSMKIYDDEAFNGSFEGYLFNNIKYQTSLLIRRFYSGTDENGKLKRKPKMESLDVPLEAGNENAETFLDQLQDPTADIDANLIYQDTLEQLAKVDPTYPTIIQMKVDDRVSFVEISEALGKTGTYHAKHEWAKRRWKHIRNLFSSMDL